MWLFKPIFIDGFGSRYLQRRDSSEASIADRIWMVMKTLASSIKPVANFLLAQWQTRAWPFLKGLLDSLKK
jgi:hypothetical protein